MLATERHLCLKLWKLMLFVLQNRKHHSIKVSCLNPSIQKNYSCMCNMPMFTVCYFSLCWVLFLPFFWRTFTLMFQATNFPFLSKLTFWFMFSPLFPLFTFICCRYIVHCFVFSLLGCSVCILHIARSLLWLNFELEFCTMLFLFSVRF